MKRVIPLVVLVLAGPAAGCEESKSRAKAAVKKVDEVVDNLDLDEAKAQLSRARDAVARGLDTAVECSWAARIADDVARDALQDPIRELKRICSFDAPLARATKAVASAEKARAAQPEAPSLTECSSDDWANMQQLLDASPYASEPRWTEVKARWAKACPDAR